MKDEKKRELERYRVQCYGNPVTPSGCGAAAAPTTLADPSTSGSRGADKTRVVLHFDLDAFYAQVSRRAALSSAKRPLYATWLA